MHDLLYVSFREEINIEKKVWNEGYTNVIKEKKKRETMEIKVEH